MKKDKTKQNYGLLAMMLLIGVLIGYLIGAVIVNHDPYVKVPVAKQMLTSNEEILELNIHYVDVKRSMVDEFDIITDVSKIYGYHVEAGYVIPEEGFFYEEAIKEDYISSYEYNNIEEGYTLFIIEKEDEEKITTGDKVTIYVDYEEDNEEKYGEFLTNVLVIDVNDDNVIVSISEDDYTLLTAAKYIDDLDISFNESFDKEKVDKIEIENFINSKISPIT